mgnify:CR=1 FL=1
MSKDMGFFVYLGYIREIPGVYARGDSVFYLQRLLSPPLIPPEKRQTIAARLSFTLAGGYLSHRL